MTTLVDIVNRALQSIGTRTTVSAGELASGSSNEAIQANIALNDTRDDLARMAPWNCSMSVVNLTLISALPGTPENPGSYNGVWVPGLPLPPWAYEYEYPSDCLRALAIVPQAVPATSVPIFPLGSGFAPVSSGPPVKFKVGIDQYLPVGATPANPAGSGGAPADNRVILTNQPSACLRYCHQVTDPNQMDTLFQSAWSAVLGARLAMALTGDKTIANMLIQQANKAIMDARAIDGNEDVIINDVTPDFIAARGYATDPFWTGGFNWGPLWPTV